MLGPACRSNCCALCTRALGCRQKELLCIVDMAKLTKKSERPSSFMLFPERRRHWQYTRPPFEMINSAGNLGMVPPMKQAN